MKKQNHTHTPPRRTLLRSLVSLFALSAAVTSSTQAADWYLKANQGSSNSWAQPVTDWTANPDGTGANPASIGAADSFDTNNRTLRTPAVNTTTTFPGGVLRLTGGSGVIGMKTGNTATAIVPKLVSTAGTIDAWHTGNQFFRADEWENNAPAFTALKAIAAGTFKVTVGKLTGSGETRLIGAGTIRLDFTDAERYLGTLRVSSGKVDFDNDLFTSGPLVIETGATAVLDQAVSFAGLTVGATVYPPNTYTLAALQAAHPGVFTGTSAGSITVRAPRNWYLTVNQASTQNWTEAYLSNWNSAANGSGVAPTSINGYDTYINQVANREIRTPATASTFSGGAFALASGAKLTLKSSPGVTSTIPTFVNTGSPIIVNGGGNFRQSVAVGDWEIASGITKLSAGSGRGLGFAIDYLTGTGGLVTQNGGSYFLSLLDGLGYTGTLNHASGALRFESNFSTAGPLTIGSAATVHLDKQVYVTALNVAGVAKPAGFHTYASLNAAHPAQFTAGAAPGLVAVYTPDTAGPVRMNGVNLSGPESTGGSNTPFPGTLGSQWIYPTEADFNYYNSKGLKLIRLPFRWERIQSAHYQPLVAAEVAQIDLVLARASARGMKVILDMHNYAQWWESQSVRHKFGTPQVPMAAYAHVWKLIADRYKNNPAIYGFDIMNEPNGLAGGVWVAYAQAAINAIREVNLTSWVIVEGEHWANSWNFESKNPNLHTVRDPVGRLMFSAHSYWCKANNDNYGTYDAENGHPMMGVNSLKHFVDWLRKHDAHGFVGEYGVPNDDPRWLVVLDNALAYLAQENISGTYWAGGAWLAGSHISCQPINGVDRPVMSILQNHP